MPGYDVEASELFTASAMVADTATDARDQLARLRAAADDLLGHGWQGRAGAAFGDGWQDWDSGARLVLSALDAMARALRVTAVEYDENENTVTGDFERIAS